MFWFPLALGKTGQGFLPASDTSAFPTQSPGLGGCNGSGSRGGAISHLHVRAHGRWTPSQGRQHVASENRDEIFVFALRWPDLNNPLLVTFNKRYTKKKVMHY